MNTIFDARRRSLEEAFFAKHNAQLLEKLREKGKRTRKQKLIEACGIDDDRVLQPLLELDIEAESVVALTLVPLIRVAWADGSIRPEERLAVMNAAAQEGIVEGSPCAALLENWLKQKPEPRLVEAWKNYVSALSDTLEPKARESLRDQVIGRARDVAEATGGFLGLGNRISKSEERILAELEMAFL